MYGTKGIVNLNVVFERIHIFETIFIFFEFLSTFVKMIFFNIYFAPDILQFSTQTILVLIDKFAQFSRQPGCSRDSLAFLGQVDKGTQLGTTIWLTSGVRIIYFLKFLK